MIDIWLKATDGAAAQATSANYANALGPRAKDGFFYICIRGDAPIRIPDGCVEISAEEGSSVLGVWA